MPRQDLASNYPAPALRRISIVCMFAAALSAILTLVWLVWLFWPAAVGTTRPTEPFARRSVARLHTKAPVAGPAKSSPFGGPVLHKGRPPVPVSATRDIAE